jgi:transketolase
MRELYLELLFNYAKANKNVVIITGDLGFGALDNFFKELPDQIFNLGIAEQSIVSIAAGLASEGKNVFIYSIANFISLRVLEQIRNDLCYHRLPVKILAIGTGYSYGQLGFSHHATEDISVIRSIPNIMILNPSDQQEVRLSFKLSIETKIPVYIRLDKTTQEIHQKSLEKSFFPLKVIGNGDIIVLASGRIVKDVFDTLVQLDNITNRITLYSCPVIKPIRIDLTFLNSIPTISKLITVEEHNLSGGFGSMIIEKLNESKFDINLNKVIRIGINDVMVEEVGDRDYLIGNNKIISSLISELT